MVASGLCEGGVLAFAGRTEGEVGDGDRSALAEAGRMASALGSPWAAACFAPLSSEDLDALEPYAVPELLEVQAGAGIGDRPRAQAEALAEAARRAKARVVLLVHDDLGETLAPALACRLGAALWTENVGFEPAGGDGLRLARRALGHRAVETRIWDGSGPLVLTLDRQFASPAPLPGTVRHRPTPRTVAVDPAANGSGQTVLVRIPPDPQTVDVSEADVVFCAGKGFDAESFERYRELARLVGASLGVTRPVYDAGWTEFERMIGQTGRTVAPRLYLGVGISGSAHHVGGVRDARRLVCLNSDPKAPFFPNADEGFVADLREVLPLLLERVRARIGGAA